MFQRFDAAIDQALASGSSVYGVSKRSIALTAARRAARENCEKAVAEATKGRVGFAAIHDTASQRFSADVASLESGREPTHKTIDFYLSMAKTYRKTDAKAEAAAAEAAQTPGTKVVDFAQRRGPAHAA